MATTTKDHRKILDQIAKLKAQLKPMCCVCGIDKASVLERHTEASGLVVDICANCHREIHSGV
jgi:hypothetical protein